MALQDIYPEFAQWAASEQSYAKAFAVGPPAWFDPTVGGLSTGGAGFSPRDIETLGDGFNRDVANLAYQQAYDPANPAGTGEAMSVKYQVDILAAAERAFRLRHCSVLRASAHATARATGHADPAGVFNDGAIRYAQNLRQSGLTGKNRS